MSGLTAIAVSVVAAFAGLVFVRARGLAREETASRLRLHAETLAGLLEIGRDGVEFEMGETALPEYRRPGSGLYAAILDPSGEVVIKSPSLGDRKLPAPPDWSPDLAAVEELASGPDGSPCAVITRGFVAHTEKGVDPAKWSPPPAQALRYRIQVAHDVRERDRGLAALGWFLALAGAAVTALTVGAGLLLARLVLRPIRRMTREASSLTPEDAGRRLHPSTVVEELHSLALTLNSALDRLAAALDRQRRFTSDASHELRTPVSVLLAGTELLLRKPRTPEEYREGLERQLRTVRRMKEITENLLTLARGDAAADGISRDPVDLGAVLAAECDEFLPLAEEKGVRILRGIEAGVRVSGDRRTLAQLAANLLSNAVKFTPAGGSVTARLAREDGRAALSVADTGPGIPERHREHLFERFYRVREGRDESEGAGLGLAIVDWIVKAHGGALEVESRPGDGSEFRVRLPLLAGLEPPARAQAPVVGNEVAPGPPAGAAGSPGGSGKEESS